MTDKEELDVINVSQYSYSEGRWAIWCLIYTGMWVLDWYFQGLLSDIYSESGQIAIFENFFFLPRLIFIPLVIFAFTSYIRNHVKRVNLIFGMSNDLRKEATRRYGNSANPKAFMLGNFAISIDFKRASA